VRFFRKIPKLGVKDLGLFRIEGFVCPDDSMGLGGPCGFGCDVDPGSPTHVKMVSISSDNAGCAGAGAGGGPMELAHDNKRVNLGRFNNFVNYFTFQSTFSLPSTYDYYNTLLKPNMN
jgi:hypothetical protein